MDHGYIERCNVVERYVANRLTAAERVAFEEHYIACEKCLDQLEQAEEAPGEDRRKGKEWFRCRLIGVSSAAPSAPPRPAAGPQIVNPSASVVPVFLLSPTTEDPVPSPISAMGRFVLCLDLLPDPRATRFDASVADQSGGVISMADGVPPPASGSLGITLHSSGLRPGRYVVAVQGRAANDEPVQTVHFAFRFAGLAQGPGNFRQN